MLGLLFIWEIAGTITQVSPVTPKKLKYQKPEGIDVTRCKIGEVDLNLIGLHMWLVPFFLKKKKNKTKDISSLVNLGIIKPLTLKISLEEISIKQCDI